MSAISLILAAVITANAPSAVLPTNAVAAVGATNRVVKAGPPAHITSDSTYYDRKEGIAVFKGNVHVNDSEYQMHARRAYVFMSVSNTLNSIAAKGSVALTNGTRRAYGEKVTYHRENGLVVLSGESGKPALVIEDAADGPRTVRGKKIRFWISREQVEVLEADLSAQVSGDKALPFALPGAGK